MSKHHSHHHHHGRNNGSTNHNHHTITGYTPHHHHLTDSSYISATTNSNSHHHVSDHHHHHATHSLDLVTTLRSELAAISYKRDRLVTELTETKSHLCAKDSECESLRTQAARQTALINSLQSRLQAAETREHAIQSRCDSTIDTITHEKRCVDEKNKELMGEVRRLEIDFANEESHKEQTKQTLNELVRKLCIGLELDVCDPLHLSPDCLINKVGDVVTELHRLQQKLASTCDSLTGCENELLNLKTISNSEKDRLNSQLDAMQSHNHDLESRCRQYERDLQVLRDRLSESEIYNEKLKEELRGFESRCQRLQNTMDRFQNDRMTFLRCLAGLLNTGEPCETLIKDRVREILSDNQATHTQLHNVKDQLSSELARSKETVDSLNCRLHQIESQKCETDDKLEKSIAEVHDLRHEHMTLCEYLMKLARALSWSECSSPPAHGTDTTMLAESLLERAERLTTHHEHHAHMCDKNCHEHAGHHSHHHHGPKLRRERSCHDIPLKESSTLYTLQRRIRVLREQVQRRDLHLELLRRKIALLEDGNRGKCILQSERDEAVCRTKKASKQIDKLTAQLHEAKQHISEMKNQLAEAVEHKITSLERARKIDELNTRNCDLENEKQRLVAQVAALRERTRSAMSTSQERKCRDEVLINSLREDISRLERQLSDANHRLSHLQSFRTSVARTLHLRDLPEHDLLHRLQTLCNAHQEFTLLSKRYESASPIEHPCPRLLDDNLPGATTITNHCRPISATLPKKGSAQNKNRSKCDDDFKSGSHHHHHFKDDHFEDLDDYDFMKKY